MTTTVYLRRPPDWEEHEKPFLPGSPSMPHHVPWVRLCYALVALLVGLTGALGNALFTANLPTIQGQLGLTAVEAAWLSGAYVTFNVTANLLVYKFRQQYGMRLFAEIGLGIYALITLLHLVLGSYESLVLLRGVSGLAAAVCSSLGTLYMLQATSRKHTLKMLVIGVGLSQLATPLAWMLSPSLLDHGQWQNLYLFEAGLALLAFAAVVVLKLPPGVHIQAFERLDFVTMALLIPGSGLLVAVLVQGYTRWWFDAPELAWMLMGAIGLLSVGLYIEHHRKNPLLHTRWFTQAATIRFVVGAIVLRFLTAEQSYGVIGMLRTLGMTPDQMQSLFAVILLGSVVGMVASSLTMGVENLGKQLLAALLLLGVGTVLDFHRTSFDRPADFFLSQFLMAMGAGIFMGPLMLLGLSQGLKNGANHMLTAILTISLTQTLGGLVGSAALSTYQMHRTQVYTAAIGQQLNTTNPLVAQRLQQQQQALASQTPDMALRAAQGTAQLAQVVRREASVRAYNDVFHVVALIALAYLLWSLLSIGQARRAAAQAAARNHQSNAQTAAQGATDAAANDEAETDPPETAAAATRPAAPAPAG
jgi:MFS family permease